MPRRGRPKALLELTIDEREQLARWTRWTRRRKSSQALALRSRIVLACGQGLNNAQVAERVGCSANTVSKWRSRFVAHRLDGLVDDPRPGRPATITVECHALVAGEDGQKVRAVILVDRADLEGVRAETAP